MKIFLETSGMATLTLPDGTEIEGTGSLTVHERGGMKDGQGTFSSESRSMIKAIEAAGHSTLRFANGVTAKIRVTKAGAGGLQFVTSGAIVRE